MTMKTPLLFLFIAHGAYTYGQVTQIPEEKFWRKADAVWSKKIWETVDLKNPSNRILYEPAQSAYEKSNLIELIKQLVRSGRIAVYDPNYDDFSVKLSPNEVKACWTERIKKTFEVPYPPYEQYDSILTNSFQNSTVKRLKIKEEWYYNRERDFMEVKIIGICPVREMYDEQTGAYMGYYNMFWLYFPELNLYLSQYALLKSYTLNGIEIKTLADIFTYRLFKGYIYKAGNETGKTIADYSGYGMDQLLEADKQREEIRNAEEELWPK